MRACTTACTGEAENGHKSDVKSGAKGGIPVAASTGEKPAEGELQELVDKLAKLTPEQRKVVLCAVRGL